MRKRQPMQPVVWDGQGEIRFQDNKIVEYLLDRGGLDMNRLRREVQAPRGDWEQFYQLVGYSVSGYADLSMVRDFAYDRAAKAAKVLLRQLPIDPALIVRGGDNPVKS